MTYGVPETTSRGQRVLHPSPDQLIGTVTALRTPVVRHP